MHKMCYFSDPKMLCHFTTTTFFPVLNIYLKWTKNVCVLDDVIQHSDVSKSGPIYVDHNFLLFCSKCKTEPAPKQINSST